ncbi:Cilia- and flagella-associated protein 43 [Cichlidogyrus casuarinus]|uniref:Cilia- and flagella-associated protein 43 n=1 Tax=Cichlidogyrus casuarinus TaxID=1844966 RepID=A0ABD2QJQ2_9PLAT
MRDYDGYINSQISTTEQALQTLRVTHQRKLKDKQAKFTIYDVTRRKKFEAMNSKRAAEVHELNLGVNKAAQAYCRSTAGINVAEKYQKRYEIIRKRRNMVALAKSQGADIEILRREVERLRLRTFPALIQPNQSL